MTGYSSRSDQLWSIAQQLVEEEIKSIPFPQQEEHGQRIQTKYNQLVNNLSCLGKIIAAMYQEKKLTPKEFEQIQHLQSTPIRANEELLSIIARKPRDVYECFLSLIKDTNQLHLYQMLVSGDDTCDKEGVSSHKDLIRRNFVWLSDKLETENGLISLLYQQNVLTVREREDIFSTNNTFRRSELLLGLLSKKSPEDFDKFLKTLSVSGQGHLAKKLSKPEAIEFTSSPDEIATDPSAALTPKIINHQPLPNDIHKFRQKPVPVRSFQKPIPPPKTLPKSGQKLISSRSLSKPDPPPKPGTQSISAQHYTQTMHTVAKTTEKAINFQRAEVVKFQAKLKGLVSRLKTDIAIKVTDVSLLYFEKPEDNLKIFFDILLQECQQMRKEIVARNIETNKELEQLRKSASQHSAAATLNEVFRTQLQSMQQELSSERLQNKKERMELEEKLNNLKIEIHNEKRKCKRLEEEKLLKVKNNAVIVELKDSLRKAGCDKLFYQQQIHELNKHLASTASELQNSKDNFKESNTEIILLRTERETLKEACEILRKESEITNDLKVQLLHTQENSRDLVTQLKEKDRSLQLIEEENLELNKEIEDRLKKAQRDTQLLQQQVHKLNDSLASTEYELQNTKRNFEKSNTEMISLRAESEKLKKSYEILRKENETRNDLEVQLLHQQENDRDIQTRLKDKEINLEDKLLDKERNLEKEKHFEKESSSNFEESNNEVISLNTESEKLKEACEELRKKNVIRTDLELQLLHTRENNGDLLRRLKEKEKSFVEEKSMEKEKRLEKNISLEIAEEETLELIRTLKDTVEEKSQEYDLILQLQEELDSEKHRKQELEDKLNNATAQLEQLTRKLEGIAITHVTQESHVIRSNHQFLVENINSSRLIHLLHETNCLADEERDHLNQQASSLCRNDALLQWMRTISFRQYKGRMVLECFRQTKQKFAAEILEKGGVVIKSKLSAKMEKVGLFVKSTTKKTEELKEMEVRVIEKLNRPQGLSLSSIQSATSEIADDDIVIVPYCHQEAEGIVIWFWCQSKHGQRNLKSMYLSDKLLGKLITIFKEFSNDSVSSASKILVPINITIFVDDFTKNEYLPANVIYSRTLTRIHTIRTPSAVANNRSITGTAILNNELFIFSQMESEVDVYDCTRLWFRRRWQLNDLMDPDDAASCVRNRCLYISDNKAAGKEIFRIDVEGNIINRWSIGEESGQLSVTNQATVILSLHNSSRLVEYSADGLLIREVKLSPTGLTHPIHAVRLVNGNFVITQGYLDDAIHRVCEVNPDGKYLRSFGAEKGSGSGHLTNPTYLAVDPEGSIMVADAGNGRVILIGSNFEYKRELITKNNGLHIPTRICLDEINGRLYVAEYKRDMRSLLVFNVR